MRATRNRIRNIPNVNFFINVIVARTLLGKKGDAKSKLPIVTRRAVFFLIGRKNVPGSLPQRSRVREIPPFLSISCREWQHPVSISRPNFSTPFLAIMRRVRIHCEKSELESASLSLSRFLFCDAQRSYVCITVIIGVILGRENYTVSRLL